MGKTRDLFSRKLEILKQTSHKDGSYVVSEMV